VGSVRRGDSGLIIPVSFVVDYALGKVPQVRLHQARVVRAVGAKVLEAARREGRARTATAPRLARTATPTSPSPSLKNGWGGFRQRGAAPF
jgi:hypothetical protein